VNELGHSPLLLVATLVPEPWVKKLETPRAIPGELRLGAITLSRFG
jgi:hypothetical protein